MSPTDGLALNPHHARSQPLRNQDIDELILAAHLDRPVRAAIVARMIGVDFIALQKLARRGLLPAATKATSRRNEYNARAICRHIGLDWTRVVVDESLNLVSRG